MSLLLAIVLVTLCASPFHAPSRCFVVSRHDGAAAVAGVERTPRAQSRTFVNRARHSLHVPVPPSSGQCRHDVVERPSSIICYEMALVVCFYEKKPRVVSFSISF